MRKNPLGCEKRKLSIWSAVTSCAVLGAMAWSLGASQPVKDAQTYACTDSCYGKYRVCLMAGNDPTGCALQYMNCNLNCTFGGLSAPKNVN